MAVRADEGHGRQVGVRWDGHEGEAAPRPGTGRGPGLEVEGGRLSRSGPDERVPYVVLDAARIVAYALPLPGTPLDLVSDVMGRIRVEVL